MCDEKGGPYIHHSHNTFIQHKVTHCQQQKRQCLKFMFIMVSFYFFWQCPIQNLGLSAGSKNIWITSLRWDVVFFKLYISLPWWFLAGPPEWGWGHLGNIFSGRWPQDWCPAGGAGKMEEKRKTKAWETTTKGSLLGVEIPGMCFYWV